MIIAKGLQENASFGEIAKELGKDRTTIAKEIEYRDHELIRRILPKGMSFDDLTQKDIILKPKLLKK